MNTETDHLGNAKGYLDQLAEVDTNQGEEPVSVRDYMEPIAYALVAIADSLDGLNQHLFDISESLRAK